MNRHDYTRFSGFKHDPALGEKITARADREGVTRSELLRRAVAYGIANMPAGWHPGRAGKGKP